MLEHDLMHELIKAALSRGGDYADVFAEYRHPTYIMLEEGRIEKAVSGITRGVGIRVIFDGRTAYAYTNELTPGALRETALTLARSVSGSKTGPREAVADLTVRRPAVEFSVIKPPSSVGIELKSALVTDADRAARGMGPAIRQVTAMYRDFTQRVAIAASDGTFAEDDRTYMLGMVNVVAAECGVVQTGYETVGGNIGFEIFDADALVSAARSAASKALALLKAPRARGGRMPVVISSEAGGTLVHEAIGHGLEADLAGQGLSTFSGKLGQVVASPLVSVLDDATLPGRRGSFRFDDEGVPSERTVLVKDGVLVGYMYDRLSAMREGARSTGNGRRESYMHRPVVRMTNTLIAPGGSDPAEVLGSTPVGLFVRRMGGGQVNTVSGDFVFDVSEGYTIRDGQLGELVRGATLTGNGPEVLKSIDMVGSDLGFAIGTCGKDGQGVPVADAMPTLRIAEMVVGGVAG